LLADRYKIHDIELVIDQVDVRFENEKRLTDSVTLALKQGKGTINDNGRGQRAKTEGEKHSVLAHLTSSISFFSRKLMCPTSGISYDEPQPNTFSFNSPYGACQKCNGLGHISEVDVHKIIPDFGKSIYKGGIVPVGEHKSNWIFMQLEAIAHKYHFSLRDPIKKIPEHALNIILYGSDEMFKVQNDREAIRIITPFPLKAS